MGRHSRSKSRSRSRGRGAIGPEDAYDEGQDGYRVHLADLGIDCSQKELERQFNKFGETREIWLAKNPPCFAFIVYKHKSDAEEAIKEMNGRIVCNSRVRVTWARPRTRGRNTRFDPGMRCYQCGERGHFSRDCNGSRRGSRYDDDRRRRRSRSRSRDRRRRRRSHSRSRSSRRNTRRSRSRSHSRDRKRRHNRSRSNDRHRQRSRSKSRDRKETRKQSRSRSPKPIVDFAMDEINGTHSNIKINGSEEAIKQINNSRSSSRHSAVSLENGVNNPVLTADLSPQQNRNGDIYDPTKTDDEEDEFDEGKDLLNGHNADTIITDYHSDVEEE